MKFMRCVFFLVLCLGMVLSYALAQAGDSGEIRPEMTALEATREMGNGINLGNTMEACDYTQNPFQNGEWTKTPTQYEVSWGQPVTTQEMISGMKAAGFDTLRIPVAWMTNASTLPFTMGECILNPAYLERVGEIVDYARNAGMYVIINDHWDGGWWGMFGSENPDTVATAMEAYQSMWRQVAEYFRDYSDYVIFESANEELGARFDENAYCYAKDSITTYLTEEERYDLCNQVNQVFVDTVRSTGGNNEQRFLLIAGYGTNIASTFDYRFQMPEDSAENKLMISVHYYDPWSYCGASSAAGATLWGKASDYETMYKTLSQMSKFTAQGYGVVIGEYGALPGSDGVLKENTLAYHRCFLDCCDALDYTSCLWDCSGFYIRSEGQMAEEGLAQLYRSRNFSAEEGRSREEIASAGEQAVRDAIAAAPETLVETAFTLDDSTCIAWIMFSEGSWNISYSVGDTYTPDSLTPGVIPTDVEVTGEGTYTVALDFTGSANGYAENTAFCAVGLSNGESLFPGYCINITQVKVNGEAVKLKGRNYTCSDDGRCTRANLFNEWVDMKNVDASIARVMYGDLTGISATPLNRDLECMSRISTLEVTFAFGPHK